MTWQFIAGGIGFFALAFVIVKAEDWGYLIHRTRGPQIGWAIILIWGSSCAILMSFSDATKHSAGLNCYVDWDGRTNPDVCD